MPKQIRKRNGVVVQFDASKIHNAIRKANQAVGDEVMTPQMIDVLTKKVSDSVEGNGVPTVEQVQDRVEEQLIAYGYAKTANPRGGKQPHGHLQGADLPRREGRRYQA